MIDSASLEKNLMKLNFNNYTQWSTKVTGLLTFTDQINHILFEEKNPTNEWIENDQIVLKILNNFIDDDVKISIGNCKTAYEFWSKLKIASDMFSTKIQNDYQLINSIENFKFLKNDLSSLEKFDVLCNKIQASNIIIGDQRYRTIKLFNNLKSSVQQQLMNEDDKTMDYELIKSKFLSECDDQDESKVETTTSNIKSESFDETSSSDNDGKIDSYQDNAIIIDSTKLNQTNNNSSIIKDIRFMKPEDLEASMKNKTENQYTKTNSYLGFNRQNFSENPKTTKNSRDRKSSRDSRKKYSCDENSETESLKKASSRNPYDSTQYASMELFKKLQSSENIESCIELLNNDLASQKEKNYNTN